MATTSSPSVDEANVHNTNKTKASFAVHPFTDGWIHNQQFTLWTTINLGMDAEEHLAPVPACTLSTIVTNSLMPLRLMHALAHYLPTSLDDKYSWFRVPPSHDSAILNDLHIPLQILEQAIFTHQLIPTSI